MSAGLWPLICMFSNLIKQPDSIRAMACWLLLQACALHSKDSSHKSDFIAPLPSWLLELTQWLISTDSCRCWSLSVLSKKQSFRRPLMALISQTTINVLNQWKKKSHLWRWETSKTGQIYGNFNKHMSPRTIEDAWFESTPQHVNCQLEDDCSDDEDNAICTSFHGGDGGRGSCFWRTESSDRYRFNGPVFWPLFGSVRKGNNNLYEAPRDAYEKYFGRSWQGAVEQLESDGSFFNL